MKTLVSRCPIEEAMQVLSGRWPTLLLYYLKDGTKRFSDLQRDNPTISPKMLALELRKLESAGIVQRTEFGGYPLRVDYQLTPAGLRLVPLIDALHAHGFDIAIETNGTIPVPEGIDWVCVSPKMGSELVVTKGDELKVVMPQAGQDFAAYEQLDFRYFLVQAMDGPLARQNTAAAVDFCQRHPRWRLSLQTHKLLGIR